MPQRDHTKHLRPRSRTVLASTTAACLVLGGLALGAVPASAADGDAWMPPTPANWPTVVTDSATPDVPITAGVTEHSDVLNTVTGRQPVQLLEVDASDANVRLGVVGAGQTLINPADETPSSMANRTGAVAGINGGFFQINASGQPNDGQIVDGEIWKSPTHNHPGTFVVLADGTSAIRDEEFSGTIAVGGRTHPLFSINWTGDASGDQITEITPRLGSPTDLPANPVFAQGTTNDGGASITVTSIAPVASLPALAGGTAGLLASAAGGEWLSANVHVGDTVTVSHAIAPDNDIEQLLQGPGQPLIAGGEITPDYGNGNPAGLNPETAIGISADGKHLTMVALDGRGTSATAIGPSVAQVAGYLKQKGVDSALLLDGGGSTSLVARQPGEQQVSVMNLPSDAGNVERPVGNGIFVYSTATDAGAPATASIAGGNPVDAVVGIPAPVRAYTLDAHGNPTDAGTPTVTVDPASLGSWSGGTFQPAAAGSGTLTVSQGAATASVPLTVAATLSSLSASPAAPDLDNGATTTFALTGHAAGLSTPIAAGAATWTLSDPALGAIDSATGVFTAAASGSGIEAITVSAAGAETVIEVGVGSKGQVLDPMNDSTAWKYNITNGAVATTSTDPDVPPGSTESSSIRLDYSMPGTPGVHQMVLSPKNPVTIDKNSAGQNPTAIAVWIKDDDQVHNAFQFATSYKQGNGQSATLYNTGVQYNGWSLLKTQLPAGTVFPLTLSWVDMLSINPTLASTGTMRLSSLQVLYAARTPEEPEYTPIPENPSWLHYVESPSEFTPGGQTILMGDDAHMLADDPDGTSSHVMDDIAGLVNGSGYTTADGTKVAPLPDAAVPDVVQMLGDMADNGDPANLQYAAQKISALGLPYHDLVGNHEITQGATPENVNFNQTFGETHYSYTVGSATVIASDNAHGGVTSSNPFQVPDAEQYDWLVKQLDAVTTPVAVVAIHMPAYDPFPAKNSQFTDRWEAQQYLQLVQNYQTAHPDRHVIMTYGHARGFAEQILDPQGDAVSGSAGIPQLTFGDLGMPAYTTPDKGGFYHFGLVHIANDGTVQFAVQAVLQSLSIDGAAEPVAAASDRVTALDATAAADATDADLTVGDTLALTASGVNQSGDNLDPVVVPIADPVSHVWASSDAAVAAVDAVTGEVTALAAGTTTVSVTAGGMTAEKTITVEAAPSQPGDGDGGGNGGDGGNGDGGTGDGGSGGGGSTPGDGGGSGSTPGDASGSTGNGTASSTSADGSLASTGANGPAGLALGLGAFLVLALGGGLLVMRRRRRA
ncbi:phosphodiester glycosidase family protein [Herbiconiux sp. CPCC 205763]|uniref:Phosphodiester glycosidase family protein n=1 Tax=Herbiconiux aconitum TaxID=2970913 RepID=A0ABT2GVB0_9MICO|nr:phosphodiester glycosidase family protein [Herbiconiux aconitum]MCS5720155.1 phosphodiester glycosidase family protein [Herbiconiux aconitum]